MTTRARAHANRARGIYQKMLGSPLLPTLLVCSSLLIAYWFYKRRATLRKEPVINRVLFFPDTETANRLSRKSKRNDPNLEQSSLFQLMETVQGAKRTLDVCMFTMACRELGEVLIRAHQDGIPVRVITDIEQSTSTGSQVRKLRRAGIQVRTDNTSYFMHHKFVLIDNRVLINGSLNWTLQGVCGNQENVTISTNPELVQPFVRQFEHLWNLYNPGKL